MKRVLIVDDAAFIRKMIRGILEKEKDNLLIVGEAENGRVAVEKYMARKPDVVLLDLIMPEMDGVSCLREIKKVDPNAKVIICSTVDDPKTVQDIFRIGIVDFITKPIKGERLLRALHRAFPDEDFSIEDKGSEGVSDSSRVKTVSKQENKPKSGLENDFDFGQDLDLDLDLDFDI